ncbi:helix-turn-helix transcriptional regulator [Streptomyces sp. N35]|uniref:helix-turn-helix transcriptional regulator n=1 Tax=Streptomyces sp. N35 TaxID=2795730 RepID=UPI0035ABE584
MRVINGPGLRRRRQRLGYSQRNLAALVGCAHGTIGFIETGRMPTCSFKLANKICRWLDVDLEDFFEEREASAVPKMPHGARGTRRAVAV